VEVTAALLSARADKETQRRYEDLANRHCEGRLTAAELRELESLVRREPPDQRAAGGGAEMSPSTIYLARVNGN
jgi:hypothetical protein